MVDDRRWHLDLDPLCNKISEHLGLDGRPGGIRNALTHQLECPLRDSSCGIPVLDDLAEREGRHDRHWIRLEVVIQLPLGDKDGVQEFLDLGVASLRIEQDLANEVHGMLHFEGVSLFFSLYHQGGAEHLHGGHNVEQKRFPVDQGTAFVRSCLTLSSAS